MSLAGLVSLVASDPSVAEALRTDSDLVVPPAATAPAIAAVAQGVTGRPRTVLAVTATTREADDLVAALGSLLDPATVGDFPSWETLPHERLSPRTDTVGRRIAMLRRLAHPDRDDPGAGPLSVLVAPVRALLQPFAVGLGDIAPVRLQVGDEIDVQATVEQLVEGGYLRTDIVERRGEFAVRGGILDVFPAVEEHPLRVELWGDTVEEIRWFKAADQRSLEAAPHGVWAPPTRELPLTAQVRARAAALLQQHPALADVLGQLAEGIAVEGMESLSPVLTDGMELLVDVVPADTSVILVDPERVQGPQRRAAPHQRGVPGGLVGERGSRQRDAHRPRVGVVPRARRPRGGCPQPLPPLARDRSVRVVGRGRRPLHASSDRGVPRRHGASARLHR